MKRALVASAISLFAIGCGHPAMKPTSSVPVHAQPKVDVVLPATAPAATARTPSRMREPGDFVVYRFSGSYRESPVTLTQQVVSREHGYLIVDVTVDERGARQLLRLRIAEGGERKGELVSVARLEGKVQVPFGVAAYGQLMNEIVLSADENAGLVDATTMLVNVDGDDLYCDVTAYRVRVGAHEAVMTTVSSEEFKWGHVGGEIATSDGKLLYKAEIVDIGANANNQVAAQEDIEIYEDDYDHFEE